MTERQIARLCVRGGFWTLAILLGVLLGWRLGMMVFEWAAE